MSKPKKSNLINVACALFSYFYNIEMLLFTNIVQLYVYLRWNIPTFNFKYNVGISQHYIVVIG